MEDSKKTRWTSFLAGGAWTLLLMQLGLFNIEPVLFRIPLFSISGTPVICCIVESAFQAFHGPIRFFAEII